MLGAATKLRISSFRATFIQFIDNHHQNNLVSCKTPSCVCRKIYVCLVKFSLVSRALTKLTHSLCTDESKCIRHEFIIFAFCVIFAHIARVSRRRARSTSLYAQQSMLLALAKVIHQIEAHSLCECMSIEHTSVAIKIRNIYISFYVSLSIDSHIYLPSAGLHRTHSYYVFKSSFHFACHSGVASKRK